MAISQSQADFLTAVPVFAGLDAAMREELVTGGTRVGIAAGDLLFREGDDADGLYVVLSGRLEAYVEVPQRETLRVLPRGAVIGELAILTGAPRSATVVAKRDSDLLFIGREHFTRLLENAPGFAVAVTRELGHQLRQSRGLPPAVTPVPAVVSLVPLVAGLPVDALAHDLRDRLKDGRRADMLERPEGNDDDPVASFARALDAVERDTEQVLLVAREPDGRDPWTSFCIREADRALALCLAGDAIPEWVGRQASLRGCDLVVADWRPGDGFTDWIDALDPRAVHVLPAAGAGGAIARLARRLSGRSVALVLSGGGARGFAHIGALQELHAAGIVVDRVAGTSMGAYLGGQMAAGRSIEEIRATCVSEFVERSPVDDYTVPVVSVTRGRKARSMVQRTFGDVLIEEFEREFMCVSCDLVASELVLHRRGPAWEGIGASMSLPGVVPPVAASGRLLVDGGVLNNLPVEAMAMRGEGPVIAVDITNRFEPLAKPGRFQRPRPRRLAKRVRNAVVGFEDTLPSLGETLIASMTLGSVDTAAEAQRHADLVIAPEVTGAGLLEFTRLDEMVEAGRRGTLAALEGAAPETLGLLR